MVRYDFIGAQVHNNRNMLMQHLFYEIQYIVLK